MRTKKIVLLIASVLMAVQLSSCNEAPELEEAPAQTIMQEPELTAVPTPEPTVEPTVVPTPKPTLEPTPTPTPEPTILEQFTEYYEQNNEMVGWIRVPGTRIDYPVVQHSDNEYYLEHGFDREPSGAGTPFLDKDADILKYNRSLSLFAHHLSSGNMFTDLDYYKSLEYYKENPIFEFDTIYEEGTYKVFAAFYMAGTIADANFYYYPVSRFRSDEAFMEHVEEIRRRSKIKTPLEVEAEDRIVLLTCCSYETEDLRFIVAGRKVRDSESTEVETQKAELNASPLYPQIWYDTFG